MSKTDVSVGSKTAATVGALASLSLCFFGFNLPPAAFSQVAAPARTVRVVKGDTLEAIAARQGVSVEELMRLNKITSPETLQIGQQLKLPPAKGVVQVGPGDTMETLASRHGTSVAALRKANPEVKPDQLKVGTWLRLPPITAKPKAPAQAPVKAPVKAAAPTPAPAGVRKPGAAPAPAKPPAIPPATTSASPPPSPLKPNQAEGGRWRYFGNTVVDWSGWKLHPGGVRVTLVQPTQADVGAIRSRATAVAVHCSSLRQSWLLNGAWEPWEVPEGRSVGQQIVLDLCANVTDPTGTSAPPPPAP
jgi:LysM repeat protein